MDNLPTLPHHASGTVRQDHAAFVAELCVLGRVEVTTKCLRKPSSAREPAPVVTTPNFKRWRSLVGDCLATHGSETGAFPGLRHGMYLVLSWGLPAGVFRSLVRYFGSLSVGFMVVLHTLRPPGTRSPLPSHSEQPIVHPCENQKHDCPDSHGSVPLLQSQPKGIYFQWPVIGNCRWCRTLSELLFHGSSCESIAFRDGGYNIEPWASAHGSSATSSAAPVAAQSTETAISAAVSSPLGGQQRVQYRTEQWVAASPTRRYRAAHLASPPTLPSEPCTF